MSGDQKCPVFNVFVKQNYFQWSSYNSISCYKMYMQFVISLGWIIAHLNKNQHIIDKEIQ